MVSLDSNACKQKENKSFGQDNLFSLIEGKKILISGATGLIGQTLVYSIIESTQSTIVFALIRNLEKAKKIFARIIPTKRLVFVVADILQPINFNEKVEYIIHAASETSSKAFVNAPFETISIALDGTRNMLKLAQALNVESFVYLSTMEIYGTPQTDEKITENHPTNLDTMNVRSSYPESKRLCESLCTAFASEYKLPAKVVRLTQTFGPGVSYDDGRVFAEFARCAIEKRDIILHTKGETKRNYLYTLDASKAILTVLLRGETGSAYNAANECTYCSVYEMANIVAKKIMKGKIKVIINDADASNFGYAQSHKMNLSSAKLSALGWAPTCDLEDMFRRLILSMGGENSLL